MPEPSFEVKAFPRERGNIVDALEVGARRHLVHGLIEVDVTLARERIRAHRERTGEALSFTAFVVACVARAVDAHRMLHAYRDWRGRLVLFDEVDVATLIESEEGGVAIPHVLRAANRRSLRELHEEIRRVQSRPATSDQRSGWLMRLSAWTPGFLKRCFLRLLRRCPFWMKRVAGTVVVTAIGQFGRGGGWGVGISPLHTLAVTVGGICQKPGVVDGQVAVREFLDLTVSVDHDLVDGAPAARFARTLAGSLEAASLLEADASRKAED